MKIEDLPTATCDVCGGKAYLISTETELATVMRHAQDKVDETVPGLSYCYKVGEELASRSVDITSWGSYQIGTAEDAPFTGHFDFSGLTIKVKSSGTGLFPYVGKDAETNKVGYVKDLTIYQEGNGPVVSTKVFGGGVIDGIKAYPVYSGTVKANGFGGIVKEIGTIVDKSADFLLSAEAVGTLKNSSITMSTVGNAPVTYQNYGALVYRSAGLVENCHARYSDSDENYNIAGGLSHNLMGNAVLRNCTNTIPSNGTKIVTGGYFGGIDLATRSGVTIENCRVKIGTINSTYIAEGYAGGITGLLVDDAYSGTNDKIIIRNCRVEGERLYGLNYTGGIVGMIDASTSVGDVAITNCYVNIGELSGIYATGGLVSSVQSGKNTLSVAIKLYNNTVVIEEFRCRDERNRWASMGGFVSWIWGPNITAEISGCNGYFKNFIGAAANPVKSSQYIALIGGAFAGSSTLSITKSFTRLMDGSMEYYDKVGSIIAMVYRKYVSWTMTADQISYSLAYQKNGVSYYPMITEEVPYFEEPVKDWTYQRGTKVYDANAAGTPADYIMPETPPSEVMQPAAGYESQERSKLTATFNGGELTLKIDLKSAYAGYSIDSLYYSLHGGTWNSDTQLVYQGKVCGNVGAEYAFGDGVSPAGEITVKTIAGEYQETNLCVKVKLISGNDVRWVTFYGGGAVAEDLF